MVGLVKLIVGRVRAVVGGDDVGGGTKTGAWAAFGVVVAGTVAAGSGATVVAGASSSSSAGTVVAEDDPAPVDDPDPEEEDPDDELVPDDSTVATGPTVRPVRFGTRSGGVSSAGLALDMNRLKIWAGRDPPLTLDTPWMLWSGFDWPSG